MTVKYKPTFIGGNQTGLIQNRQNFLLPNDAYPRLVNAYVWRESIKRKQGVQTLDRLRRIFDNYMGGASGVSPWSFNLYTAINKSGTVVAASKANPIQITTGAAHGLFTGQFVNFASIGGMTQLNGNAYQITVTGGATFTLDNIDGTLAYYTAYTAGGTWTTGVVGIADEPNKTIECGSVDITLTPTTTTATIISYTKTAKNRNDTRFETAAAHGFSVGDIIQISGIITRPNTGPNKINGGPYTITNVNSAVTFRIGVNSSSFGTYQSGGLATRISSGAGIRLFDQGDGTLATIPASGVTGTINYLTGDVTITGAGAGLQSLISFSYFPGLPVMGILTEETSLVNTDQTIFFDTKYAYFWNNKFEEFLPGKTWTGSNSDFFWGTNYWVDSQNNKIFWETTYNADPIRYTNGNENTNWVDFSPSIDAAGTLLNTCRCLVPFRGRLVAFNTQESGVFFQNRIRWCQIGNPFTVQSAIVSTVDATAWRDDIRGKGGFLDVPTNENIITVGFVRDNLVVYCERTTWQLRYTGLSVAPFQIEKVNAELGVESTFSGVQFDTSIVGIGDKGIVECDSYQSRRIDIKIPDLVQSQISNQGNGIERVYGIRDFENRLVYWIYPSVEFFVSNPEYENVFPNRRLCYNYENESFAIFTDSLTALGTFQNSNGPRWSDPDIGSDPWALANYPWEINESLFPIITGGNQQGYILYLNQQVTNDRSLFITAITGRSATFEATIITSPNHNLEDGMIIQIEGIFGDFSTLNDVIFGIVVTGLDTFTIFTYNSLTGNFDTPQLNAIGTYIGCGEIKIRDNFSIVSKRFNYNDDGQAFQLGYVDVLVETTPEGAFSANIYNDYEPYDITRASNRTPQNVNDDSFFNTTIETYVLSDSLDGGEKQWRRLYCPTNSNFITIEYTLSNAQMNSDAQENDVVIDAQTVWSRPGGRKAFLL